MKTKGKPGSKNPAAQAGPNRKKVPEIPGGRLDAAFFKKNEFALILVGALLLTLIIFFVFFRSDDPAPQVATTPPGSASSFEALEKRIAALETAVKNFNPETAKGGTAPAAAVGPLQDRVTRLETAFLVKFETLIERMEGMEKKLAAASLPPAPVQKTTVAAAKKTVTVTKPPVKTPKKTKKPNLFHTVKKGETLYSISKKYKIPVKTLQTLNNLSAKDKIFPGNNIIVR